MVLMSSRGLWPVVNRIVIAIAITAVGVRLEVSSTAVVLRRLVFGVRDVMGEVAGAEATVEIGEEANGHATGRRHTGLAQFDRRAGGGPLFYAPARELFLRPRARLVG
jgi:hypothetical protein